MINVTIKNRTKQAKAVIEMLKTFDFVEFNTKQVVKPAPVKQLKKPTQKDIMALSMMVNKAANKRFLAYHKITV